MPVFLVAILWLAGTPLASAHLGASALIIVSADFIMPGQQFEVVASDMGPDASVELRIEHEPTIAPLGTIRAAPDGHFMTNLVLPADFPTGYAQLFATAATDAAVSTWVLVGERTASTPASPGAAPWWTDPSVLVLLFTLMGALLSVGYVVLRPRRAAVEALPAVPRRAPRQRKRDRRPGS